jgi:DNA-binding response OmpR family regulator
MVLVVDDDKNIVDVLRAALKGEGYTVQTASDGVEAYEHLKAPDCRCLLLDMNMPRINGAELLMLMQTEGISVPTIVMAGFDDFEERELKQFGNVSKYLHKPFEMEDMLEAVRTHMRK